MLLKVVLYIVVQHVVVYIVCTKYGVCE